MAKLYRFNTHNSEYRAICFGHAGGYANQYFVWKDLLPSKVECIVYERPGSGLRYNESQIDNWEKLMEDAWEELHKYLDKPFLIYGHSLGGLIAYEFCKSIQKNGFQQPLVLIIGDKEAPSIKSINPFSNLSDEIFIKSINEQFNYGFMDKEIIDIFLPILRNEMKLAESYFDKMINQSHRIETAITILVAENKVDKGNYKLWKDFTAKGCVLINIEGDHFFHIKKPQLVINYIKKFLNFD